MKKKIDKKENAFGKVIFSQKLFLVFSIIVLIPIFFTVYNKTFDKKVFLGGDNAAYYILGNALATGQGFTNIHTKALSPHNHFTPGYPVLIAATIKLFSNDIETIKRANGLFFFLSLIILFLILFKITGNYYIPFIVTLFTMLNYNLINYSYIMMSEIPFMLFTLLSIWLVMLVDFSLPLKKNWLFFLLILSISFAYYIRTIGVALFGAVVFVLLLKKNWKYLTALVTGFVLLALPWFIRSKSLGGNSYMKQIIRKNPYRPELGNVDISDWPTRIWENISRYITREIPNGTLDFTQVMRNKAPVTTSEWVVGLIVLAIIIFGLTRLKKYKVLIISYLLFSFGILMLWPSVWFGVRFLVPLIPILTFALLYGIVEMIVWFSKKVLKINNQSFVYLTLAILSLFVVRSYAEKPITRLSNAAKGHFVAKYKDYFDIARWVKKNTSDTSVTCCRKGQLFYLYSNKYVTGYKNTLDVDEQLKFLKSKDVDYVVLDRLGYSSTGRYLLPAIQLNPEKFKLILHKKKSDTYFYKYLPDLGYWGEWKDGKRSGHGTYAWENGNTFEGEWKNGVRNGPGAFVLKNGNVIKGNWVDDKLDGEITVTNKEGKVIETSIYKKNKLIATYKEGKLVYIK